MSVRPSNGNGLSELELRSLLTQTLWTLEGDPASFMIVVRGDLDHEFTIQ
jgi:hypothetical protein